MWLSADSVPWGLLARGLAKFLRNGSPPSPRAASYNMAAGFIAMSYQGAQAHITESQPAPVSFQRSKLYPSPH